MEDNKHFASLVDGGVQDVFSIQPQSEDSEESQETIENQDDFETQEEPELDQSSLETEEEQELEEDEEEDSEEGEEESESESEEESGEEVNVAYVTAQSLVEKGLLSEDQLSEDIDFVKIRDLIVMNGVQRLDQDYKVDERVHQLASQLGFTKEYKEYLDYLSLGGSETNVIKAARYDNLLAIDTSLEGEQGDENIDKVLRAYLKESNVSEDLINDQIELIHKNEKTQEALSKAKSLFKEKRKTAVDDHKESLQKQKEANEKAQAAWAQKVDSVIESGKFGLEVDLSPQEKNQFKQDFSARTEKVETPQGTVYMSKLQKLIHEAQTDPEAYVKIHYNILYADKMKEKAKEVGKQSRDQELLNLSNRRPKVTNKNKSREARVKKLLYESLI